MKRFQIILDYKVKMVEMFSHTMLPSVITCTQKPSLLASVVLFSTKASSSGLNCSINT